MFRGRSLLAISSLPFVALVSSGLFSACGGDGDTESPFFGQGGASTCVGAACDSPVVDGPGTQLGAGGEINVDRPRGQAIECAEAGDGTGLDVALADVEAAGATVSIHLNHLGFDLDGSKRVVVEASAPLSGFQVVRESDNRVFFEGSLEDQGSFADWGGATHHYVADFTDLLDTGAFVLRVNGVSSPTFEIAADHLFATTITDIVGFFRNSRADDSAVWLADETVPFHGSRSGTADVRGGWYDASGDISKYLTHLSNGNFTNPQQIPLTAWSLAWVKDTASAQLTTHGLDDDVESEALWGADYLVRVQDEAGYFYTNIFDGWSGNLSDSSRTICGFTTDQGTKNANYQAAFREGAGLAIASLARVAAWQTDGAFSAADYLAAAETGFSHLQENNTTYCYDGKENIIDDYAALLAASELYATTGTDSYLTAARARATALEERLDPSGYFIADDGTRPFWHASDAGLPVVALVRYAEVETDSARVDVALDAVATHLEYLLTVTDEQSNPFGYARQHFNSGGQLMSGFFIPHDNETGYWWQGESARLGSLAAAVILGARALEYNGCEHGVEREFASYASNQLDWVLGKNPYDISMVAGYGRNNPPGYLDFLGDTSAKSGYHNHLDGGISNGITGRNTNGSGIQWRSPTATGDNKWHDWRWIEQWLPHSTWYMVAITAMAQD